MEFNLCIPTLNRYDLLIRCLESAEAGTLKPTAYYIIDNGMNLDLNTIPKEFGNRVYIAKVKYNLGVARSWNWFIDNIKDHIIFCNDDIEFYEDSIEKLMSGYDENFAIYPAIGSTSFSLIQFPRKIFEDVGYFDEGISPFYAYFEDNDYHYRMKLKGYDIKSINGCKVKHVGSATIKKFTILEQNMHHGKFEAAKYRYLIKWGGIPGKEKFTEPFDGKENGITRKDNS
jgi:GT2 family glycosyltransferase